MSDSSGNEPALSQPTSDAPGLSAARLLAEAIEVLRTSEDSKERRRAASVVGEHGDDRMTAALLTALRASPSDHDAGALTRAVIKVMGEDRAVAPLLDVVYAADWPVQAGVLHALPPTREVMAVIIVMLGHPDLPERRRYARMLESYGAAAVDWMRLVIANGVDSLLGVVDDPERLKTLIGEVVQRYRRENLRGPRWSLHFDVEWQRQAELLRSIGHCARTYDDRHIIFEMLKMGLNHSRYWEYALEGIVNLRTPQAFELVHTMITDRPGPRGSRAANLLGQHFPHSLPTVIAISLDLNEAARHNLPSAFRIMDRSKQRQYLRALARLSDEALARAVRITAEVPAFHYERIHPLIDSFPREVAAILRAQARGSS